MTFIYVGKCTACGQPLGVRPPVPVGAGSVCVYCRAIVIITATGLRDPDDNELLKILHNRAAQADMQRVAERHAAGVFR